MKRYSMFAAIAALSFSAHSYAQEASAHSSGMAVAQAEAPAPSPNQIVDEASADEWVRIPAEDLLVMELARDAQGDTRTVVIQLMPAPFSQGWVENIRTLARAKWYDGITVNRVQDNYVVQWGDPNYDNPEAEGEAKPLPEGLRVMGEGDYSVTDFELLFDTIEAAFPEGGPLESAAYQSDSYGTKPYHFRGWPITFGFTSDMGGGTESLTDASPVHCYGMVGVGRNYSPDTGSGAELYTVIGHAPRHLDRNIALVGRIISGMEHLSSLPRGSGMLGFYTEEEKERRVPILSIRVASDIPEFPQPTFEYLSTESESFARYAEARANRRDPFFIHPAGGADICNIPVPVRRVVAD